MDDLMQTDGCGGGPYYKLRLSTYYYYTVIDVLIRTGGCSGGPYYKLRLALALAWFRTLQSITYHELNRRKTVVWPINPYQSVTLLWQHA